MTDDLTPTSGPVICWGELLWDVIKDAERDVEVPGGSPLNVAFHLNRLGHTAYPVSAVGDDRRGRALLDFMDGHGIPRDHVGIVFGLPTGVARVEAGPDGLPLFSIDEVSAWDRIPIGPHLEKLAAGAKAIVFGSLAQRGPANLDSLISLLESTSALKVMDANLRPPFDDHRTVLQLARQADILKVSESELHSLLASWSDQVGRDGTRGNDDIRAAAIELSRFTTVPLIAVTFGSDGAAILDHDAWHFQRAANVPVEDTVGAGDAFLAGLLAGHLAGLPWEGALAGACRTAEATVGHRGAIPSSRFPASPGKG
ncbi:MAG TPA: PfkB family carbohydrate kinase [Myxococcota bacterium]|nr:PfkB family carbohydrate kinase [Myxococcota bacterium]HOA13431.1 PfkB family carbohydrate kinase [Myxococcota bacterium]HOC98549.1 PfkB family carbohydrate kinase [Myxococcota bacterium]HOH76614.1 PfkB family carbohydrate kinase [Myxococcota bacterium]HPV03687.1 PfkB family carbohydrate kinase [Myxococcota bacterium]